MFIGARYRVFEKKTTSSARSAENRKISFRHELKKMFSDVSERDLYPA